MNEQDEIQRRDQQIAEIDKVLREAKKAFDMETWARENDIDLDRVMAAVRRRCSPAEYEQAQQQALDDFNRLQQATAQSHQSGQAPRRSPRTMV